MRWLGLSCVALLCFVVFSSAASTTPPVWDPANSGCLTFACSSGGGVATLAPLPSASPRPSPSGGGGGGVVTLNMILVCPDAIIAAGLTQKEAEDMISKETGGHCVYAGSCEKGTTGCSCCNANKTKRCPIFGGEPLACAAGNWGANCTHDTDCAVRICDKTTNRCILQSGSDTETDHICPKKSDSQCGHYICVPSGTQLGKSTCTWVSLADKTYPLCTDAGSGVGSDCSKHLACVTDASRASSSCQYVKTPGTDTCSLTDPGACSHYVCKDDPYSHTVPKLKKCYPLPFPGTSECTPSTGVADCNKGSGIVPAPSETMWDTYGWWSLAMVVVVIGAYFAITNFFMQRKTERKRR